jgi:hypothetical protein
MEMEQDKKTTGTVMQRMQTHGYRRGNRPNQIKPNSNSNQKHQRAKTSWKPKQTPILKKQLVMLSVHR